jgi:hypothetical protein
MLISSTTIIISKLLSMTEVKRKGGLHYGVILILMVGGQPRRSSLPRNRLLWDRESP